MTDSFALCELITGKVHVVVDCCCMIYKRHCNQWKNNRNASPSKQGMATIFESIKKVELKFKHVDFIFSLAQHLLVKYLKFPFIFIRGGQRLKILIVINFVAKKLISS